MSKKKQHPSGMVYSTDPSFMQDLSAEEPANTPTPAEQVLRVRLDTRQRAGKAVTLIEGFTGREADLEALGKKLRNHCGTGGSAKDGVVIVQGDQREKVLQWLLRNGYAKSRT